MSYSNSDEMIEQASNNLGDILGSAKDEDNIEPELDYYYGVPMEFKLGGLDSINGFKAPKSKRECVDWGRCMAIKKFLDNSNSEAYIKRHKDANSKIKKYLMYAAVGGTVLALSGGFGVTFSIGSVALANALTSFAAVGILSSPFPILQAYYKRKNNEYKKAFDNKDKPVKEGDTSPRQKFIACLNQGDFKKAMNIAKEYKLDKVLTDESEKWAIKHAKYVRQEAKASGNTYDYQEFREKLIKAKSENKKAESDQNLEIEKREQFNKNSSTLMKYCSNGKLDVNVLSALIENDSNINFKNNNGDTALTVIASNPYVTGEMVNMLIEASATPDVKNNEGLNAIQIMQENNVFNPTAIKALIEGGVDPKIKNNEGYTILDSLILNKNFQYPGLYNYLLENEVKLSENIFKNIDFLNDVVLNHEAKPEVIPILKKMGFDVHGKNENNETYLLSAVKTDNPDFNKIKILIESGIDVSIKDNDGNNALDIAIEKGHNIDSEMAYLLSPNKNNKPVANAIKKHVASRETKTENNEGVEVERHHFNRPSL